MAWDRSQFEEEKNRHDYENEYKKWQLRREQESAWLQREIRSLNRRVFQHEREDDERKRKERKAKDEEERKERMEERIKERIRIEETEWKRIKEELDREIENKD